MKASSTIHSFLLSQQEGQTLLTAQERPWSVLQVIPTTPADFDRTVAALEERGMVAHHDTDRTFCIIHLASGDHDGKHPERHIAITQNNHKQIIEELKDTIAQAVVWYETNIIEPIKNDRIMANRNTQKVNTFTFLGAEYEAPASLNENIRAWFWHNSPHEPQLNMIPSNVRFSAVKNVLTATTYEDLPDWYAALDSVPRDLIYCCVESRVKK